MELKAFIKQSLKEIISGIAEADDELGGETFQYNTLQGGDRRGGLVEYDIAVTVEDHSKSSAETKAEAGIKVLEVVSIADIQGNISGESERKNMNVSRIKFLVGISPGITPKSILNKNNSEK